MRSGRLQRPGRDHQPELFAAHNRREVERWGALGRRLARHVE